MIRHALFLAFQYLLSAPIRTMTLVFGLTLTFSLPLFSYMAADVMQAQLLSRGNSTPLLIGKKGNEFDLTLNSLYFRGRIKDPITMSVVEDISSKSHGLILPIYVAHSASSAPIVGTSVEYFEARGLDIVDGRKFAVLGEVVVGADLVESFQLKVGDTIRSDASNLYNIAGAYPMILKVVGVLAPSNTADDGAFFADVKTIWTIDGYLHGHDSVKKKDALNPDAEEGENIEASAAVFMFQDISKQNLSRFHAHGSYSELPLSAAIVFPTNQQSHDQLLGEFQLSETMQAVRPSKVIETILDIVMGVKRGLNAYFVAVAFSTLAFFVLVLSLSMRLRASELALIRRIGGSRGVVLSMVFAEITLIVGVSIAASIGLSVAAIEALKLFLVG